MAEAAQELFTSLIRECRRRLLDVSLPQIRTCLAQLSDEELWLRPNEQSNSMGNLVLHLCGNVRQYVIAGLGGAADVRERAKEFAERGPVPRAALLERLEQTLAEAGKVLDRLDPAGILEKQTVQGFEYDGVGILIHVVEHFSYHTGQIAYFVKARKGIDLGFYRGVDLNVTKRA